MKTKTSILLLVTAAIAAGCSTPKIGTPEYVEYQERERIKSMTKLAEQTLDKAPDWFIKPPVDAKAVYAAATDYSNDLQFAIDKATLSAKVGLAAQINSKVSSKMKEFAHESGFGTDAQINREIERVSSETVTEVSLSGYSNPRREIFQQGTGFRAYVLLRYPIGEANRLAVQQTKKSNLLDAKIRASKAFQELEADIAKAKKE